MRRSNRTAAREPTASAQSAIDAPRATRSRRAATAAAASPTATRAIRAKQPKNNTKAAEQTENPKSTDVSGRKRKAVAADLKDSKRAKKAAPEEDCVICYNPLEYAVKLSECGHVFCKCCLLDWEDMDKKSCPVCRKPFEGPVRRMTCPEGEASFNVKVAKKKAASNLGDKLVLASRCGHYHHVSSLLNLGAHANRTDSKGRTALYWILHNNANRSGECEACVTRERCPCPHCAARQCTCLPIVQAIDAAKRLLECKQGKDCGGCVSNDCTSELVLAVAGNAVEVVMTMLDKIERMSRFDFEATYKNNTALEWAIKHNYEDIAFRLLRLGARVMQLTRHDKVPLYLRLSSMCMRRVIDEGQHVRVRNVENSLPEHIFQSIRDPIGQRGTTPIPMSGIDVSGLQAVHEREFRSGLDMSDEYSYGDEDSYFDESIYDDEELDDFIGLRSGSAHMGSSDDDDEGAISDEEMMPGAAYGRGGDMRRVFSEEEIRALRDAHFEVEESEDSDEADYDGSDESHVPHRNHSDDDHHADMSDFVEVD